MSDIDRRQVQRHFSASCKNYDGFADVQKRVAQRLADLVRSEGPSQGRFLEVGTGTGYFAELLTQFNPQLQPLISDLAHGMTRIAKQRLPRSWAVDLDAAALPIASGSLPLICSASVYQWVENLGTAFGECLRVLQSEGLFICALFGNRTLWQLKDCFREALFLEGYGEPDYLLTLPGKTLVEKSLREGGFEIFRVWEEEEEEQHVSVPSLLRSIKGVGAHNASQRRPRGLSSRRVMHRLSEIYGQRFSAGDFLPATYHVIYIVARKV
jgi:malonyl-CoA O-methyltransferase